MRRGYTRGRIRTCGPGAGEVWRAVVRALEGPDAAGPPVPVGAVGPVFDRSAYVEFDPEAVGDDGLLGPPLVLLGGHGFDGPLVTVVETDGPGGFRPDGLTPGAPCRVYPATAGGLRPRYVLRVGDALDVQVDPGRLSPAPGTAPTFQDIATLGRASGTWQRGTAILDLLDRHEVADGLGWLPGLARLAAGDRPPDELGRLVDGWTGVLGGECEARPPAPPASLLGRGPGATPSGDDLLAGLFLALDRTATDARRPRLRQAGERLVATAAERTTTVSTALLAQAVRGRADDRVETALRAVLSQSVPRSRWEPAVLGITEVGHTSGVDTLVGMLVVTLGIGPELHANR